MDMMIIHRDRVMTIYEIHSEIVDYVSIFLNALYVAGEKLLDKHVSDKLQILFIYLFLKKKKKKKKHLFLFIKLETLGFSVVKVHNSQ